MAFALLSSFLVELGLLEMPAAAYGEHLAQALTLALAAVDLAIHSFSGSAPARLRRHGA